jgi:molecular chaperone DnaK
VPQVQVSFDIDANGLLQVSATDRTTGRQQSVSIQGGSNLSETEIKQLIEEAERKSSEDRRRKAEIDRRNRALTLVAQAERRLRDAALELGPYGAERQQRAVEVAMRDVQEQLNGDDLSDLDLSVSQLQEALYGLNRRLAKERSQDSNPLQGLKNTLGSLKDELFADDDWDDWDRGRSRDPWADSSWGGSSRAGSAFNGSAGYGNGAGERYDQPRYDQSRFDQSRFEQSRFEQSRYDQPRDIQYRDDQFRDDRFREDQFSEDEFSEDNFNEDNRRWDRYRADASERDPGRDPDRDLVSQRRTSRQDPFDGDPWAED